MILCSTGVLWIRIVLVFLLEEMKNQLRKRWSRNRRKTKKWMKTIKKLYNKIFIMSTNFWKKKSPRKKIERKANFLRQKRSLLKKYLRKEIKKKKKSRSKRKDQWAQYQKLSLSRRIWIHGIKFCFFSRRTCNQVPR